jgi:hypothetical protein
VITSLELVIATATTATAATTTTVAAATAAAPSAAATAAATATATAIATATAASRTFFTRLSFVDAKVTTHPLSAVKCCNGCFFFFVSRHFYESEPARLASFAVRWDLYTFDGTVLSKDLTKVFLGHTVGQVAHINRHRTLQRKNEKERQVSESVYAGMKIYNKDALN